MEFTNGTCMLGPLTRGGHFSHQCVRKHTESLSATATPPLSLSLCLSVSLSLSLSLVRSLPPLGPSPPLPLPYSMERLELPGARSARRGAAADLWVPRQRVSVTS